MINFPQIFRRLFVPKPGPQEGHGSRPPDADGRNPAASTDEIAEHAAETRDAAAPKSKSKPQPAKPQPASSDKT